MAGTIYIRQSSFADGDTITAALFNNEFNQLANAFAYTTSGTTGHTHDGTDGQGGNIGKIGDQDFKNKIVVDTSNNRWGVFVEVGGVTTEQVRIQDGAFVPVVDSDINLGSPTAYFKDSYIDTVTTTGAVTVGGALSAASFSIGGTALTATITELNTLDGITSTVTELNYTDGVTSNIQTQLNAKQPLDAQLTDIAALTPTDGTFIVGDGTNFVAEAPATALASLGVTSTATELNVLDGITATTTELNYVHNVTSPIQTQLNAKQALNAKLTDISNLTLADNFFLVSTGANLALESPATALGSLGVTANATELNYVDGVTSSIQTQINTKAPLASPTFTGELTAPTINASSSLKIGGAVVGATATELSYTSGVTSSIQDQLDALQTGDTDLAAIAALTPSDSTFIVGNGTSWVAETGAIVRTSLGLTIGTDVQAYSAVLNATTASFTTADENKLGGIEASADVTDTANVTAAGALMDSEVTNLAQVKAFDSSDYATAAQGATADSAVQNLSDLSITATATEINTLDGITATTTELNYVSGVTSSIQSQINGKEPADATILKDADIGSTVQAYDANIVSDANLASFATAFTVPTSDGTSGQALVTDGSGNIAFAGVNATQLGGKAPAYYDDRSINALGSISGTTNIDLSSGTNVTATISGATTFTVSNLTTGSINTITLLLTNAGAYTVTFPTGTTFNRDTAPILAASGNTIIVLETYDDGTTYKGIQVWRDTA